MIEEIKKALESFDGEWKEKKGVWEFSATIAERKVFLSKKKLTYSAKMRIDDDAKVVKFSENSQTPFFSFHSPSQISKAFLISSIILTPLINTNIHVGVYFTLHKYTNKFYESSPVK